MGDAVTVRYVSGDWSAALGQVRLRMESDRSSPQDLLFSPADIQPLITLLLVLSGKAGRTPLTETGLDVRDVVPLRPDFLRLGETDDGDVVLQLDIGQTKLAFSLPSQISTQLGQSLIAMSASRRKRPPTSARTGPARRADSEDKENDMSNQRKG